MLIPKPLLAQYITGGLKKPRKWKPHENFMRNFLARKVVVRPPSPPEFLNYLMLFIIWKYV